MTARRRVLAITLLAAGCAAGVAHAQIPTGSPEELYRDDVHARAGLKCEACHSQSAAGQFVALKRTAIAPLCAHCHSDAAYMRSVSSQLPVNQYAQYLTSTHGKKMSTGETRVATCVDCHGAHGIRSVKDVRAPVAPLHVATTCARCHSDHARMSAFGHDDDAPADWKDSVHAAALLVRGDTSAPTCSTCHGNHGVPPGVESVAQVCSQCHVREAELFRASPKKVLFESIGQPECVSCHSNHKILKPSDAFYGMKDPAVCATCHDPGVKGADVITTVQAGLASLTGAIDRATTVLDRAERAGMLVDEGRLALRDAKEQQILARVDIHAFATKPFADVAGKGIDEATRAEQIGNQAMAELKFRRNGLAVATVLIIGFLATLWLKIRRLPKVT